MQPAEHMRPAAEPEGADEELTVVSLASGGVETLQENAAHARPAGVITALVLTAVVLFWRNQESPLWWLLAALATSAWAYALLSVLGDTLRGVLEWIVEMITNARRGVGSWRDATSRFINSWVWSRFRVNRD